MVIFGIIQTLFILYCLFKIQSLKNDNEFLKQNAFLTATGLVVLLRTLKEKQIVTEEEVDQTFLKLYKNEQP